MTTDESDGLRRLKAQYRRVVASAALREAILRALVEHPERAARPRRAMGWRWSGWGRNAWAAIAVAFAAGALVAWGLREPRADKLDAVVSAMSGQAFSDERGANPLAPEAHVREGERLRTSAASAVEAKVGAHLLAVSADSGVVLESLQPRDLRFRLERGALQLTVSPLERPERLRVVAGALSVEVVGTVFEVRRTADCSGVAVRSGRVATWFQGRPGELRAGEQGRFCETPAAAAKVEPSPTASARAPGAAARDGSGKSSAKTVAQPSSEQREDATGPAGAGLAPPPVVPPASRPRATPLSDEERMFRDASRSTGEAATRALRLQEYLARFPDGTFAEDALFQLIRARYAAADAERVLDDGRQFLRRFQRGSRANEVRLLYVQSLVELGRPPGQALDTLALLLPRLDALPREQQEQASYLAVVAYCGAARPSLCRHWADRYLDRYPHGRYAAEVRRQTQNAP